MILIFSTGVELVDAFVPTCHLSLWFSKILFGKFVSLCMSTSFSFPQRTRRSPCHRSTLSPFLGPHISPFFVAHTFSVSSAVSQQAVGLGCLSGWENPPCACTDLLGALLRGLLQGHDGFWSKHGCAEWGESTTAFQGRSYSRKQSLQSPH